MPLHGLSCSAVATIYPDSDETISFLSRKLLRGELVAVPTETVYGLAADALNPDACARIFAAKERPFFDPLIVHLPLGHNPETICFSSPLLPVLKQKFWPGPLTLVLKKRPVIPDIVTAGLDSVAIRIPNHSVFQRLLTACNRPLAAPSANPFGYISPTTAEHVQESLGERIAHILDGGRCEIGIESTILDIRDPENPRILRPGIISKEELEEVLQREIREEEKPKSETKIMPGQSSRHYSPETPSVLKNQIDPAQILGNSKTAFLFFKRPVSPDLEKPNVFWLSEKGDSIEAAKNLFGQLREIDRSGFDNLIAEKAPDSGIGTAINNRLQRACQKD